MVHKKYPTLKLIKAPIESDTEYRNQTLQYIEQNGLEVGKDVLLVNEYLSLDKLVSLYQHAEIFLFPTLKEGFGFPIIEAQSCGVPVITTHYEPMNELVPYKEMTVDPHDPEDIAQKIIMILEDPELKKKMIADGLEYVKQFSWENTAKQFSQLIDTMA